MPTQKERILNALRTEAMAGPFHPVSTAVDTKLITVDTLTEVAPAEAIAQEVHTTFGDPRRHRRSFRFERRSWRWHLGCTFNQEVSTEAFEQRLIENPVILARDVANGLEQVTLRLQSADLFHPPQQNPSSGTQVTFTFEAELSPA